LFWFVFFFCQCRLVRPSSTLLAKMICYN
jgi:hypothetical protein